MSRYKKNALLLLLTIGVAAPFAAAQVAANIHYDSNFPIISPLSQPHGMVVSEQALATRVGAEILQSGGNAVDAAVAVGFALAVVLPNAGNIGGGGFMLIHDARSGRDNAIDFREMAPAAARRDMYLDAAGKVIAGRSTHSHLASGVPGSVAGFELALRKYGSMSMSQVLAPAIKLAANGFRISPYLASVLDAEREHLGRWPASRAIFFKQNRPLQSGELLVQSDLAKSFKLIAEQGGKAFYEGDIARKLVAEMERHQGLISAADLKNYRAIEREPVRGKYRGYEVVSMPPPSSGGVHLIEMLNMLEHYPLKEQGANSATTLHQMSEVMKLAYADRSEYLGDPDFLHVPVAGLTSPSYAAKLVAKIDPEHATPSSQIKPGQPPGYESDQTTHFSVADRFGNAVATTYTLNLNFGSGIVAAGTGIVLNDEMDDFSVKAGTPNAFGLVGGTANAVQALKRPLSSMTPSIVLKDGKPFLVTGSPGGSRIINITLQMLLNVIDHGMNIAEATIAPRIHQQWMPDRLYYEKGISADTLELLRKKGQNLTPANVLGKTETIQISDGQFYGFADPRSPDGLALGF
ncbi:MULTISPECIES: gamma-glutamyltransferase [unclassified Undibacterium]|uniref:gamma-glutamyltransferase n=1 Tax=unclassified Undibacterium TaxID=2630295 RepID=UPI002AC8AD44|nr:MULTISPECIES: gamma-glutamyltransferase [unclassified Undibacterium]MEB0140333.1 gamma-glutamyltransferase [Undibacterium sp. CCC2.1]MEB0172344.1 gamma-glutamyltransferase [Undibacterium sp. CCC1.1]MEB0176260.1 gamma-glutamyltransferase [Undibacterium sp. CCC3.4]MEB0215500.1 gamma-glutamyltransferase [Undibacterium sp. 5I2]WPX44354.1 gamma-glutamyltransferase [Undibacterium sp. CCC3.4]